MATDFIAEIPGAVELSNWFGGFPSFHDAKMALQINGDGTGWLKAYGFRTPGGARDDGYLVTDKHFVCTFDFEGITSASITDFMPGLAILGQLDLKKVDDGFEVDFSDTAYGLSGSLTCRAIRIAFEPGVTAP